MVRDSNKPKGRTSAYAFFVLFCRNELQNKGQSSPENLSVFFRRCSEQWKMLNASEKKTFEDLEKADHARYNQEMMNYIPMGKDCGAGQATGSAKDVELEDYEEIDEDGEEDEDANVMVKDSDKPKGRTSAYALYILSCREELRNKGQSIPENLSLFFMKCSEQWKALSPSEKKKFEDMERADQFRFDEEMTNYTPPKVSGKKRKKDSNKPRQPVSAFFIFCAKYRNMVRSQFPNLSVGEIARKLVEMWSKLSSIERTPFEQRAALLREKYDKDGGPGQAGGSTKDVQAEEEEEDDDDDDDDDDEEEEEVMEELMEEVMEDVVEEVEVEVEDDEEEDYDDDDDDHNDNEGEENDNDE